MLEPFRHDRVAWVEYLRAWHNRPSRDPLPDRISFGPPLEEYEEQRAKRLGTPTVEARIASVSEEAVTLLLPCPFCKRMHALLVSEDWETGAVVEASCGWGQYKVQFGR